VACVLVFSVQEFIGWGTCRSRTRITFSCFGDWESPVLASEGDEVLLRVARRLLCLADLSRSVGGNTVMAGEQQQKRAGLRWIPIKSAAR